MIQLHRVPTSSIREEWRWIRPFIDKAVARDPNRSIMQVWRALMVGEMDAWVIDGEAQGYVVTFEQGGDFWIGYVGGLVDGGPKQRIGIYRRIAANFEDIARRLGKPGICVGGRDWSPILDDYALTENVTHNVLRKAL